ncbi:MAG: hypothetical protein ACI8UP_004580 [Porticoccaceae bacterium]|jgi:hypothetical protein
MKTVTEDGIARQAIAAQPIEARPAQVRRVEFAAGYSIHIRGYGIYY